MQSFIEASFHNPRVSYSSSENLFTVIDIRIETVIYQLMFFCIKNTSLKLLCVRYP